MPNKPTKYSEFSIMDSVDRCLKFKQQTEGGDYKEKNNENSPRFRGIFSGSCVFTPANIYDVEKFIQSPNSFQQTISLGSKSKSFPVSRLDLSGMSEALSSNTIDIVNQKIYYLRTRYNNDTASLNEARSFDKKPSRQNEKLPSKNHTFFKEVPKKSSCVRTSASVTSALSNKRNVSSISRESSISKSRRLTTRIFGNQVSNSSCICS